MNMKARHSSQWKRYRVVQGTEAPPSEQWELRYAHHWFKSSLGNTNALLISSWLRQPCIYLFFTVQDVKYCAKLTHVRVFLTILKEEMNCRTWRLSYPPSLLDPLKDTKQAVCLQHLFNLIKRREKLCFKSTKKIPFIIQLGIKRVKSRLPRQSQ